MQTETASEQQTVVRELDQHHPSKRTVSRAASSSGCSAWLSSSRRRRVVLEGTSRATEHERKRLFWALDYRKLSREVRTHATQNERPAAAPHRGAGAAVKAGQRWPAPSAR
jgi:hypothetical protein